MNLSSLSSTELKGELRTAGIYLKTGGFITHVQSRIPSVAEGIGKLYADYPLEERPGFADFHVSLERPFNIRRWFKPQVLFRFDGKSPFKPLPFDQAFPMFEWGLNWCVSSHANRYLIIHAAVIEKDGFAAIMPAPPGSGKSTLCAALIYRGWRLLSDELTLIRAEDGAVIPLPRPVSLKNASIDIIRDYLDKPLFSKRVADTMKGDIAHLKPPEDSVRRAEEPALPGWVIFPRWQESSPVRLSVLPRSRAFMRVAENSFNFSTLGRGGFEALGRLIEASHCYEFTYSRLDDAVDAFAALSRKGVS